MSRLSVKPNNLFREHNGNAGYDANKNAILEITGYTGLIANLAVA